MSDVLEQALNHSWWYSDANITRLLIDEVRGLRRDYESAAELAREFRSEAKRLTERAQAEDGYSWEWHFNQKCDEVRLLKSTVATWERACANYVEALAARDAENKALRNELEREEREHDAATTLHATVEKEVERLRGLLAEALACLEGHGLPDDEAIGRRTIRLLATLRAELKTREVSHEA